jgi:uncharacterized repeat protein (TIGR01451 family)
VTLDEWTIYTTAEGIANNQVKDIIKDGSYIWLGTAGGVSRTNLEDKAYFLEAYEYTQSLPELAVSASEFTFSNNYPDEGDTITLSAIVWNTGPVSAANVNVSFYDGDPAGGTPGEYIGSDKVYVFTGENDTATIEWIASEGQHLLWVVVDPNNDVPEYDKLNNKANNVLFVNAVHVDQPPLFSDGTVWPSTGNETTLFTFNITYSDLDEDVPLWVRVVIDNVSYLMSEADVFDTSFVDGKLYRFQTTLEPGLRNYYFISTNSMILDNITLGNVSEPFTLFVSELDSDNDGYIDEIDLFPYDPSEWNDTDLDDIGDNADTDDDNDGYPDSEDAFPNDPEEWLDTDSDGIGNNADTDDDADGHPDSEDAYPLDPDKWEKEEEFPLLFVILILIIVLIILIFFIFKRKKGESQDEEDQFEKD